ncbi:hypothetical protein TNCV_5087731 [Trichonephila clavipes]|nr:hypothetical protein TNCV_5087731 [Trichonephila clavipes]
MREGECSEEGRPILQKNPPSGTFQLFETIKETCEIIRERSIEHNKCSKSPRYTQNEPGWYLSPARAREKPVHGYGKTYKRT